MGQLGFIAWSGAVFGQAASSGEPTSVFSLASYGITGLILILVLTGKWLRTEREVVMRDEIIAELKSVNDSYKTKFEDIVIPMLGDTQHTLSRALELLPPLEEESRAKK